MTYTVQDGSVAGHYWKTKKDKGDTSELKSFSSTYVGSDSLAELMAEHPDTKYIVNTNDPRFLGRLGDERASDDRPDRHHVLLYAPDDGRQQQEHAVWQDQRQDQRGHAPKVKFEDVAGVDEAVEELEEIRDFLSDPDRYRKLGAKIRAAFCWWAPPVPVRRCWPRPVGRRGGRAVL